MIVNNSNSNSNTYSNTHIVIGQLRAGARILTTDNSCPNIIYPEHIQIFKCIYIYIYITQITYIYILEYIMYIFEYILYLDIKLYGQYYI